MASRSLHFWGSILSDPSSDQAVLSMKAQSAFQTVLGVVAWHTIPFKPE